MADHAWRSAGVILDEVGLDGEEAASITARLRDLRKARHGSYPVECREGLIRVGKTFPIEYRVGEKGTHTPRRRAFPRLRPGVLRFAVDLEAHLVGREYAGADAFAAVRVGDDSLDAGEREALAIVILDFLDGWSK
jgi:hypothetical protein